MTKVLLRLTLWSFFGSLLLCWFVLKFIWWLVLRPPSARIAEREKLEAGIKPKKQVSKTKPKTKLKASVKPGLKLVSYTATTFKPAKAKGRTASWIPFGTQSVVQGIRVEGGGFYSGGCLPTVDGFRDENCLIDPRFPIARSGSETAQEIGYWPSYESLTPVNRRVFLEWLASSRVDPNMDLGLVFIYFYGLERRLVLDDSGVEEAVLLREVERLREVYGSDRSFYGYSSALIDVVRARQIMRNGEAGSILSPVGLSLQNRTSWVLRSELLNVFDQGREHPEPATALAWVLAAADVALPAVTRRNPAPVIDRFYSLYSDFRNTPKKLNLKPRKPIALIYQAASGTFRADFGQALGLADVPLDPVNDGRSLRKLATLLEQAIEDMVPYLKAAEKNDDVGVTLETLSKLPLEQRASIEHANTGKIADWCLPIPPTEPLPTMDDVVDALGIPISKTAVGTAEAKRAGDALARFGYGLMPDPRFCLLRVKAEDAVVLFELEAPIEELPVPSAAFSTALVRQTLSAAIAHADGSIDESEIDQLNRQNEAAPLVRDEKARLKANLEALLLNPPIWERLRSKVKALPAPYHEALLADAVSIATADGVIAQAEMQLLEKIADALDISRQTLSSLTIVDPAASEATQSELTTVRVPKPKSSVKPGPKSYAIPPEPRLDGVQIDLKRLAAIKAETEASQSLLAKVFEQESNDEPLIEAKPDPRIGEKPTGPLGEFLDALLVKDVWPLEEAKALAIALDLSPLIAIEDINQWATDTHEEPLLYIEDEELEVELAVLEKES